MKDILDAVANVLSRTSPFIEEGLVLNEHIYVVPKITWISSGSELELQIAENGSQVIDTDGSVRREDFSLVVGILLRRPKDYTGRHASVLTELYNSIFTYHTAIKNALSLHFLDVVLTKGVAAEELVIRPIVYRGVSPTLEDPKYPDLLVKEVRFTGGLNDAL